MKFTEVFADNFDRANENLNVSANWTWRGLNVAGAGLKVLSNKCTTITNASPNEGMYVGDLGPNHYVQCRMIVATGEPGIWIRSTKESTVDYGYFMRWYKGTGLFYLFRVTDAAWPGTWTSLGSVAYALTSTEYVRLSCFGDDFTLAIDGVDLYTWTDSVNVAGYAGIAVDYQADYIDDFSCGTVEYSRTWSPFPFPRLS